MSVIDDYLKGVSDEERAAIDRVYRVVRSVVPGTVEDISYGMPCLKYKNKGLISAMATKKHIGLYPFSSSVVSEVADQLAKFDYSKGTIRFTVDKPMPEALLKKIAKLRKKEIDS